LAGFDVRTSPRTAAAAWPDQPPALRILALPARLKLTLATGLEARPLGTPLAAGEALCVARGASSAVPLAPCPGRIVGVNRSQSSQQVEWEPAPGAAPEPFPPDLTADALNVLQSIEPAERAAWLDRLLECGIQADRPGCPDLVGQLHGTLRRPIDTLVCRLLEDDPPVPLGSVLAARFPHTLLMGVGLLARLTKARRVILASDAAAPGRWTAPLKAAASTLAAQLIPLRNDYPQADPTLLIYTLLGRRLRPGRSPGEVGVMLLDAAAAVAIGQAAALRRPMLQVPCSLHDQAGGRSYCFLAPVGAMPADLLAEARLEGAQTTLRMGHPLRDRRARPGTPIGGGDLSFHAAIPDEPINPAPCIRCAWCIEGCPVRIHPAGLLEAAQRQDPDLADHHGLDACIECGICTYVCPSQLPLLEGIRTLRQAEAGGPDKSAAL
jgi:electron transport complex protein RnfC